MITNARKRCKKETDMLFNKENKGAEEIRSLTSNYYLNNDFNKVAGEIETAQEELITLVGNEVFLKAQKAYDENSTDETDILLVSKLQRPIALLATFNLYRKNDLSHEDDGRKFKIDSQNEKLPWQWQLDRDDEIQLEGYYKAVDALIRFLNESDIQQWKETNTYRELQTLLIRSGSEFDTYFPIVKSERTFLLLVPFIREVQMLHVKRSYGAGWDELLTFAEGVNSDARFAACKATSLFAMSLALERLQLSIIPGGVIRRYLGENGAAKSSPARLNDIRQVVTWMSEDAKTWLNEMKQAKNGGEIQYNLIPHNCKENKFFRV
ncbi:hypothetical protein EZS27_021037 [termite gut metagenome]|uniref:Uncharacterized protein n=1 Tax=termite gut metagenome TaxID=433724 RepID=A0A5J4R964_9ZZZZ